MGTSTAAGNARFFCGQRTQNRSHQTRTARIHSKLHVLTKDLKRIISIALNKEKACGSNKLELRGYRRVPNPSLQGLYWPSKKLAFMKHSALLTLACLVFFSAGRALGGNLRSCSLNGGQKSPAELISSPKFLAIKWRNGQFIKLTRISPREFVDSNGARWYKMSNPDFLGLWSEENGKRKEVFCK